MEDEESSSGVLDGEIVGITFALATHKEICTASVSERAINHLSQLSNPFLGLPLESGKCEACRATEPDKCEGHFGFIELPVPIYHPAHITELKQMLSLLCLKFLKIKKARSTSHGLAKRLIGPCCEPHVRNTCSNSVVQLKYEVNSERGHQVLFEAGEPVGVLAAIAMSNPAYKAVLDSTSSSNSSWELMKEVLLCKGNFQNTAANNRHVILYLNECRCGKRCCQENAAYTVGNKLKRVSLKDTAVEFLVEYRKQQAISERFGIDSCLHGHIHLNKTLLEEWNNISVQDILQKCEDVITSLGQKKEKKADDLKRTNLSVSECCSFRDPCASKDSDIPCLTFSSYNATDPDLERTLEVLSNTIDPVLLDTVIKGDPRSCSANMTCSGNPWKDSSSLIRALRGKQSPETENKGKKVAEERKENVGFGILSLTTDQKAEKVSLTEDEKKHGLFCILDIENFRNDLHETDDITIIRENLERVVKRRFNRRFYIRYMAAVGNMGGKYGSQQLRFHKLDWPYADYSRDLRQRAAKCGRCHTEIRRGPALKVKFAGTTDVADGILQDLMFDNFLRCGTTPYLIVTGDVDFVRPANKLKNRGCPVYLAKPINCSRLLSDEFRLNFPLAEVFGRL